MRPAIAAAISSIGSTRPLVPPIVRTSVFTIPDLDALDRIMSGEEPGYIYARDAHPNARLLGAQLAKLEAASWGIVTSSGMAAISAIVLATVQQGQRIVASNRLYGRTVQLFQQELGRFGVGVEFVDCNDLHAVEKSLASGARILFVETMSNPLLRVVDLGRLAELSHRHGSLFVVDNTFATPTLVRPIELGADFVMESLTKILAGHGDVTLGAVVGKNSDMLGPVQAASSIWGLASNPFDCWLAERGLATLELRLKAACDNALSLAEWLPSQPGVAAVHYPGLPQHPDHAIARELLNGGFGHMLCFELAGGRDAVNCFMRQAKGIPFSPSLGDVATTLSHPATTSHRYVSAEDRHRQGIGDGLIRLSVGIEAIEALKAEFTRGLKA
ncbi:MAG: aminotransferase class I/II-fold pyridoxal phosphate-dependent enzyme [Gemmataceae bacterium]